MKLEQRMMCTGCEACVNACPKNALYMDTDSDTGFCYPKIIKELCDSCGICEKICPSDNSANNVREFRTAYAAYSKNNCIRLESTSGGMFTVFSNYIISLGGEVYGAGYDEDMNVVHMCVNSSEDIYKLQKSKYVQSKIGLIYKSVKSSLDNNISVLFVGAPCQIAGLYAFLNRDYDRLYTIEFICLGVNSPLAYRLWIDEMENKYKAKLTNLWFKYKEFGWRKSPLYTKLFFDNECEEVLTPENNYFMKGYLQGSFFVRPCCSSCRFNGEKRCADIIFGDYWGADTAKECDYGTSVVLLNSQKGTLLFEAIKKDIVFYNIPLESVYDNNPRMFRSVSISPESKSFFQDLKKGTFSEVVRKYIGEDDVMPDILTRIINPE